MKRSVLIQRGFGARSNYASMFEQTAALIGEVLGYGLNCVWLTETSASSPTAPPRGFPGKLHSPDHLKSLGMGVMTASFLLAEKITSNLPKRESGNPDCCGTPGFCSNSETLGKVLYFFLEMEIPAEGG